MGRSIEKQRTRKHKKRRKAKEKVKNNAKIPKMYRNAKKHSDHASVPESAIYGELTPNSANKVIMNMKEKADLDKKSIVGELGSGIGKMVIHFNRKVGCRTLGVEIVEDRYYLAIVNLLQCMKQKLLKANDGCNFLNGNIENFSTFNCFTHVYMFSVGFPPDLWKKLCLIFNNSEPHCQWLICYMKPSKVKEYGFHVKKVDQLSTKMAGSQQRHTCYIYKRLDFVYMRQEVDLAQAKSYEPKVDLNCDKIMNPVDIDAYKKYIDERHNYHPKRKCADRKSVV